MTLREVLCIISGHRRRVTMEYRSFWEQARWMSYISVLPHIEKGKLRSPQKLVTFPWEKKKKVGVNNAAAFAQILEKKK